MKNKKKLIIISAVILFILIIILAVGKKKGLIGEKEKIKVSTEFVKKINITEIVSANGKIQPEEDIKISPYISGEVIKLYVNEGDKVKKGDLLAEIDPKIYLSSYERMEASLNSQKANLASSQARLLQSKSQFVKEELSFNRNKKLWKEDVISKSDYETAKSAYQVAEAQVASAEQNVKASKYTVNSSKASLKEAKENLTRTKIVSPSNGTVSKLNVEQGERVAGASQFSAGTEIMRIANLNEMEVNVEVNENDIVRVNLIDTCLIEVDAYLNRKFKGIVTEIATSANVSGISADQITNFNVKIRVLKTSYADLKTNSKFPPLRPGMSATVDIQTQKATDILAVPIQAVTTRIDSTGISKDKTTTEVKSKEFDPEKNEEDEEVKEYVFVFDNGIAKLQRVKTGIQDNMYIQILEGLTDKQEVIVAPYRAVSKKLKNNDEVKKVDRKLLFKKN